MGLFLSVDSVVWVWYNKENAEDEEYFGKEDTMNKIFNSTTVLILGILIFLFGCIQPARYEKAKENGSEVEATVVEVKVREENDSEGYSSTSYTVYADYEVNGKEYKHKKIGKYYDTDEYYVGKTVKVVVNPDTGKPMAEGGVLCVVGFLIAIGAVVSKIKKRKEASLG